MENEFGKWLQSVIDQRHGGRTNKFAQEIGLSATQVSRGIESGTLGTETLLRLARLTGRPASDVLRLAGKEKEADLIESCYGPPRPVAPAIREVVDLLGQLPAWAAPQTVNWLRPLRDFLQSQSIAGSAPAATKAAKKQKPAKRAVRVKSKAGSTATA